MVSYNRGQSFFSDNIWATSLNGFKAWISSNIHGKIIYIRNENEHKKNDIFYTSEHRYEWLMHFIVRKLISFTPVSIDMNCYALQSKEKWYPLYPTSPVKYTGSPSLAALIASNLSSASVLILLADHLLEEPCRAVLKENTYQAC